MAKVKISARIDEKLDTLVKKKAADFERSFAYVLELALREMFQADLPPGWKPGQDDD